MKMLTMMAAVIIASGLMPGAALADAASGGAAPAVTVTATAASTHINLPAGTLVQLRLTDPVSSRGAKPGDVGNLRGADDVYLGTKLVIRKDETTTATITEVRGPRNWGRSARLGFEFGAVKAVDGTAVALGPWSKETRKEESMGYAAGATVGGAVLLGPVGLVGGMFVKGNHVELPAGQEFKAAVRWDTAVAPNAPAAAPAPAPVAPAVIVVPAPAPAPAVEAPKTIETPKAPEPKKPEAKKPEAKKPEPKKEPEKVAPVIPIIEDITGEKPAKKG